MTDGDYAFLFDFVHRRSGLALGPEKRYLVDSRLAPVWRARGLSDLAGLVDALRLQPDDGLATSVVDALATHETFFFRDRPVFDALRDTILPALRTSRPASEPIRIWSAAASTGQEAYSIAMMAADTAPARAGASVAIVATDMVESVIERARGGLYSQMEVQRGLPIRSLLRHFRQVGLDWAIEQDIRRLVEWRVYNLLDDLRPLGSFDVIFCRNILIYLDAAAKRDLLERLTARLAPGGSLCLGSAETATGLTRKLRPHPEARGFFVAAGQEGSEPAETIALSA